MSTLQALEPLLPLVAQQQQGGSMAQAAEFQSAQQPALEHHCCLLVASPPNAKSAIVVAPAHPLPKSQFRRHQLFLAASATLNLVILLLLMPDLGFTLLLSAMTSSLLSLFAVVGRLSVPLSSTGHVETVLSRRAYRCSAVSATCDVFTLAWWTVVLALMMSDPDPAQHDALLALVAAGCLLLALHAGLCVVVATDAARVVKYMDTTGTKVQWWTWLLLGVGLALSLLVTGCVAGFLLLVVGGSTDCRPAFSKSFYD